MIFFVIQQGAVGAEHKRFLADQRKKKAQSV